jgi:hypothetical protein
MSAASAKPVITIPTPAEDAPPWLRVGVLAAVGFAVGILWPRVVGLRLGPAAPQDAASAVAAQAPGAGPVPQLRGSAQAGAAPSAAPSVVPTAAAPPEPKVSAQCTHGYAVTCRAPDGDVRKGKNCDTKGLDAVVIPKLVAIGACESADGLQGKLSVVVTAEFKRGRVVVDIGKSSTAKPSDAFVECLRKQLTAIDVGAVAHTEDRAVVAYPVTFTAIERVAAKPGEVPAAAAVVGAPAAAAGIEAEIAWDVALVRESPRTGAIVGRVRRGSKIRVLGEAQDNWYRVQFGEGAAVKDGWVVRGAIAK